MSDSTEKFLAWDGRFDTVHGDCNQRCLDDANAPAPRPKTEQMKVGLGRAFGVMHVGVSVRIIEVSPTTFVPTQDSAIIRIRIKRLDLVKWLVLRVFDAAGDLVYQEMIEARDVGRLPAIAPTHALPDKFTAWSAHPSEGPFRFQVWVGKNAMKLFKADPVPKDKEVAALADLKAGKIPAGLGIPTTATMTQKHRSWRAHSGKESWIIVRLPHGGLTVQHYLEGTVTRGVTVHDQAGRDWGKTDFELPDTTKRKVDANGLGINQVNVKAPHVRVMGYEVPAFGTGGGGTNFALTAALEKSKTIDARQKDTNRLYRACTVQAYKQYIKALAKEPPTEGVLDTSLPKDLDDTVSLLADALRKSRHYFDCAKIAQTKVPEPDTVLKVFVAPEFYFTHPDRPYTKNECYAILDDMKERSKEYKNWMFVAGSIWWADRYYQEVAGKKTQGDHIPVVTNLSAVIFNGVLLHTYLKRQASTIDGLRGYDNNDASAKTIATQINTGVHVPPNTETWSRWVDVIKETMMKTDETGFFRSHGIQFGLEVCLDHLYGFLRLDYERDFPGGLGVDVHLLVAAGMPHDAERKCALCNKVHDGGPTNCAQCNFDFSKSACPQCEGENDATAATCAGCGWNFLDHDCGVQQNIVGSTTCARCAAAPVDRMLRPSNEHHAIGCTNCGQWNDAVATDCSSCLVSLAGTPVTDFRECGRCNQISASYSATRCANCGYRFDLVQCPDCNVWNAQGRTTCTGCGWKCHCAPHRNTATSGPCGRCTSPVGLWESHIDTPGNVVNIVSRNGGYLFRNDGGYPADGPIYSEVTKTKRTGTVADQQITYDDLTFLPRKTWPSPDSVRGRLATAWRDAWTRGIKDSPVKNYLTKAGIKLFCTLPNTEIALIRSTLIGALVDPVKGEILATPQVMAVTDVGVRDANTVATYLSADQVKAACKIHDPMAKLLSTTLIKDLPAPCNAQIWGCAVIQDTLRDRKLMTQDEVVSFDKITDL